MCLHRTIKRKNSVDFVLLTAVFKLYEKFLHLRWKEDSISISYSEHKDAVFVSEVLFKASIRGKQSKDEVLQELRGYEDLKMALYKIPVQLRRHHRDLTCTCAYCPSRTLNMIYPYEFVCE